MSAGVAPAIRRRRLDPPLESFGGDRDAALDAIQSAAQNLSRPRTGVSQGVANIDGFDVMIRGAIVDGVAEIGTAFIPP